MYQNTVEEAITGASEHVAAELIGLHSELEILHIPATIEVVKFARMIPEYYSGSFSQEALILAKRIVEKKFYFKTDGLTTAEVREALMEAVEERNRFLHKNA